jgi:hypothetical protein
MTMTRPWRRITLHLSQIFLTLGLTFTAAVTSCAQPRAALEVCVDRCEAVGPGRRATVGTASA